MAILFTALAMLSALALGYFSHCYVVQIQGDAARQSAERILAEAEQEAKVLRREAEIRVKEERQDMREAFERDIRRTRKELRELEERVGAREVRLEEKRHLLDRREASVEEKSLALDQERKQVEARAVELDGREEALARELEERAGLSRDQARENLLAETEEAVRAECGALVRRHQEAAKEQAEKQARAIITRAIERFAGDQVGQVTTCTVHLDNEDLKGRIIGKEGRNIRALEAETGVNFLIDETPDAVVVSGFDPLRREVARRALERLLEDGRINPATIEETVARARTEIDEAVVEAGEQAVAELDLRGVPPEIVRTCGRLRFRTSYAQNVLRHSVEMAHLMAGLAGELGLDPRVAKRIGLFHDIGKALDHEAEGGHAGIGAELLRRHGEDPVVVNAVAAHHRDVEAESLYAHLCIAADAITAARPGARSDSTQAYLKRLQDLEEIANGFPGVNHAFAIQAGRELRVMVEPGEVGDDEAMDLARRISKRIEQDLQFPGQIRITVIRETRCVEYAS